MRLNTAFSRRIGQIKYALFSKNIFLVIVGTLILALGTALFAFPFGLVSGGVSGLSIVLEKIFSSPSLSAQRAAAALNWLFFFLGLFSLGYSFAARTLASCIVYPFGISLFSFLAKTLISPEYTDVNVGTGGLLIASVLGGTLIGIGCAITFIGGGSTGGTDVLAFIGCKLFPKLKTHTAIFATDAVIILLGAFVTANPTITFFGILTSLFSALSIKFLLTLT